MNNYIDKYKGLNGRGSVYDILSLDPNSPTDWVKIQDNYKAIDIDKVVIDGDTFTNYGDFQFAWEKTYVKSPVRSNNGGIDNLNSYATFVTPHLIINFSVMSIDDYRAIMRKDLEKNEFVVECYDPIYNERISVKMYFATQQMAKLYTIAKNRFDGEKWEEFVELVGVQGYTVELIGTNSDLETASVIYHLNPPSSVGASDYTLAESDVYRGQEIVIGTAANLIVAETFNGAYAFERWNISKDGGDKGNYINGTSCTINSTLVLYAQWVSTEEHTLSYNYGIADPSISNATHTYKSSIKVVKGKSIGALPVVDTPTVTIDGVQYSPYYNGLWYKTPIKTMISSSLRDNELYWMDRDSSIYLIYDVKYYKLKLFLDYDLYQESNIEYNIAMNLPTLYKSGYTFDGWYYNSNYIGDKASGLMPPYDVTLFARWIKEND